MFYVITGPTASGKTSRAVALARATGGEIISADSRQLYRGMDLGTGKDLEEYGDVPYHLIDIAPAGYRYNLHEYLRDFRAAFDDITSRGKTVIVCGGTGLYVESVLNGIELPPVPRDEALRARLADKSLPELAALLSTMKTLRNNSDIDTPARALRAIEIATYYHEHPHLKALTAPHPVTDAVLVGVAIDRDIDSGIDADDLIYYGLEYKYLTLHVTGRLTRDEMFTQLETAIHQFAKRQMTWFRGMERRGWHINWLPYDMPADDFTAAVLALPPTNKTTP